MPESNSEKIHKIVGELARIRDELRELVGEAGAAGGNALPGAARGAAAGADAAHSAGARLAASGNDPLDEILSAAPPPAGSVHAAGSESDDAIVVDIHLPPRVGTGTAEAGVGEMPTGTENQLMESEKPRARTYPKKPPPRKQR